MLKNGAFSDGWDDLPPAPGHLINQRPRGWTLRWIPPGGRLFESEDKAQGVPECVHKLSDQLPPHERLGADEALILAGNATYKIFHSGAPFGAELSQEVTGLQPGSVATLTVPILVDLHGETDRFGAESGVWVNDEGAWVDGFRMGDRQWHHHETTFTVPEDGRVKVAIRVKSKWPRSKDFFIDGITLDAVAMPEPPPDPETPDPETPRPPKPLPRPQPVDEDAMPAIMVIVPPGLRLVTAETDEPGVVTVIVPRGTRVNP